MRDYGYRGMIIDHDDFEFQLYKIEEKTYMIDDFTELGYCEECNLKTYVPEYQKQEAKSYSKYGDFYQFISICMECKRIIHCIDNGMMIEYDISEPNQTLLAYFNNLVYISIMRFRNNHLSKHLCHTQYRRSVLDKRLEEIKRDYQLLFDYKEELKNNEG